VTGVVVGAATNDDGAITGDSFNLQLDPNRAHMAALTPGSGGAIHCETYPDDFDNPASINRAVAWLRTRKKLDGEAFMVTDPSTGARRPLANGDHVALLGRWIIENGHPQMEYGWPDRVGYVFIELHPFDWTHIELVVPKEPWDSTREQVSVAAPIYEEVYDPEWRWNQFVGWAWAMALTSGASNYHSTMGANATIKAPALPKGFTPAASLVGFEEIIEALGTGLSVASVRTVTRQRDGISVRASITAPPDMTASIGGLFLADFNDPANGRSIFKATYRVYWKPRLVPKRGEIAVSGTLGQTTRFTIEFQNRGPDPLTILGLDLHTGPSAEFEVDMPAHRTIARHRSITLAARFTPQFSGSHRAELFVRSNDPSRRHPVVVLRGTAYAPSGTTITLSPSYSDSVLRVTEYRLQGIPSDVVFAPVPPGGHELHAVNVLNPFPAPIIVEASVSPQPFYLLGPSRLPIGAQATQSVQVAFTPTTAGSFSGALTIEELDNPQNQCFVALEGTAS
jgi:hypothetical protein